MIAHEIRRILMSRWVRRSWLRRDSRRISVAIPTYKRTDRVLATVPGLLADPRVAEVVVRDDASPEGDYARLVEGLAPLAPQVRVMRNETNHGAFDNKRLAVAECRHAWTLLLDSDNGIGPDYLDAFFALAAWSPSVIYCPQRARPKFDFTALTGMPLDLAGLSHLMRGVRRPELHVFLNTGNYIVPTRAYVQALGSYQGARVAAADVCAANLIWLRAGGLLYVLPGMDYAHDVHEGSWFKATAVESKSLVLEMGDALAAGDPAAVDRVLALLRPPAPA